MNPENVDCHLCLLCSMSPALEGVSCAREEGRDLHIVSEMVLCQMRNRQRRLAARLLKLAICDSAWRSRKFGPEVDVTAFRGCPDELSCDNPIRRLNSEMRNVCRFR